MSKIALGPRELVYPMPAFLVGANVDGKANFMTAAWGGIANSVPPMVSVGIRHARHTYKGMLQNSTFSVNIPSADIVTETDYCGIVSGAKSDKAADCGFDVFYGKLGNAPLIEQCPVNLECTVEHTLKLGSHVLFIGKIEEVHVSESCLTNGEVDVDKVDPIAYVGGPARRYQRLGEPVGTAFSIGRELKAAQ